MLRQNPHLRAIVFDRPEVLKVAEEMARQYGVRERVELVPGDMFADELPAGADVILLSNVLHDLGYSAVPTDCPAMWEYSSAGAASFEYTNVFLNDDMDGPLPIAAYSASLFSFTEGRAYSGAEYRCWLKGGWADRQTDHPHDGSLRRAQCRQELSAAGTKEAYLEKHATNLLVSLRFPARIFLWLRIGMARDCFGCFYFSGHAAHTVRWFIRIATEVVAPHECARPSLAQHHCSASHCEMPVRTGNLAR